MLFQLSGRPLNLSRRQSIYLLKNQQKCMIFSPTSNLDATFQVKGGIFPKIMKMDSKWNLKQYLKVLLGFEIIFHLYKVNI